MRLRKKPWIEEAMQDLKGEYVLMHDLENYKGRWQELLSLIHISEPTRH